MTPKIFILLLVASVLPATAGGFIELEGGWTDVVSDVVRIPGDTGTEFSLVDDFDVESMAYARFKLSGRLADRHRLELLAAPLSFTATGDAPADIHFEGVNFPEGSSMEALYRFDSYRISWLRRMGDGLGRWSWELGLTAKLRDAEVTLESPELRSSKENRGFVPLIALRVDGRLNAAWSLRLEADALAAPRGQGRAEDVLVALSRRLGSAMDLSLGYRFVEGGADVDEVYNFAYIHYLAAGLRYRF